MTGQSSHDAPLADVCRSPPARPVNDSTTRCGQVQHPAYKCNLIDAAVIVSRSDKVVLGGIGASMQSRAYGASDIVRISRG